MKKSGAGSMLWVLIAVLVVGCGKEIGGGLQFVDPEPVDASGEAGIDASSCPDYEPDGGVTYRMRGCPLTIEYSIR